MPVEYTPAPYWSYETSMGETTNVSVRAPKGVRVEDYYNFLIRFIVAHSNRLISVDKPCKFHDGAMCSIIRLDKRDEINFENKGI